MRIAFFSVVTQQVVVITQKNAVFICKQQLQNFPEFAGVIYKNSLVEFTGIAA
jgi:hypothetical protein